jgi:perosamine synthetase
MTTAEGGMVTTNSAELSERLRTFRAHGIVTNPEKRFGKEGSHFYSMEHLGHRFYMTELQAALGVCQLKKLPAFQERRRAIVAYYDRELADLNGVSLPVTRPYVRHAWHLYTVELGAGLDRDAVFTAMRAENIGVNVHYIPVHHHPYYRRTLKLRRGTYPIAEGAYRRILTLPLFPRMSDGDAEDVVRALCKVVDALRGRRFPRAKAVRGRRR